METVIALAGNPNSGKTTLFNTLTGSRQHVGNYPGVTVEKKEGVCQTHGKSVKIVDLPGTYSLTAYSVEEVVARDFLVQEKPRLIINITDAANLERNLYLTCQFLELGIPMVMALNMVDVARARGIEIDQDKLARFLGVPVVPIVAREGKGTETLMTRALEVAAQEEAWRPFRISYGEDLDGVLLEMEKTIQDRAFLTQLYPARWVAIKYLEGDQQLLARGRHTDPTVAKMLEDRVATVTAHLEKTMGSYPEAMIADHRYGFIKSMVKQGIITVKRNMDRLYASDRIDKVLTNRFFGPLIMVGVLYGLYQFVFLLSETPVSLLETFFELLGGAADRLLPDGQLKSLVTSGIIDGVGGVLGFVPLIMLMFLGLAFLEDTGYLARVAFMLDRVFRVFGLHGSSVMAYIVSGGIAGGCAVPGVLATRTLRSPKERMATLLTAPFMSCGAKVPVLALLIATFFGKDQARFMLLLTLLSWGVALLVAKLLRATVLKGESTPFVMELPPYRLPTLKGLLIHTWERTWQYIRKAGTIILGVSILLWAMMTYPQLPEKKEHFFKEQKKVVTEQMTLLQNMMGKADGQQTRAELEKALAAVEAERAEAALRHSIAGRVGIALEKVSWLAGFDWRMNIALVGGVAAKEIIIATLSTAYSLGGTEATDDRSLAETLAASPTWSPVLAVSIILFVMFYTPCFATLVCIVREAGTVKWGLFSLLFNTAFAFLLSTIVYRLGMLLPL